MKEFSLKVTQRAIDIMNILWDAKKPLAASDFPKYDSTLTLHTVHAYLKKLLENNLIEVDKIITSGNNLTRCYKPSISRAEFEAKKIITSINFQKISVSNLVSSFFEYGNNPSRELEELNELEQLIKTRKQSLEEKNIH